MCARYFVLVELMCLAAVAQSVVDSSGRIVAMLYSGETTEVRTNLYLPTPGWQTSYTLATNPATTTVTHDGEVSTWKGQVAMDAGHRIDFTQSVRTVDSKSVISLEYTVAGNLVTEGLNTNAFTIDTPFG